MNEKVTPGLISMMRTIQAKNLIPTRGSRQSRSNKFPGL